MTFDAPQNFIWALVGGLIWTLSYFRALKPSELFIPVRNIKKTRTLYLYKKSLPYLLGIGAWVLLGYALMGPKKAMTGAKNSTYVRDIFFVMDVSRSMLAEDFSPNRLEVAKEKLINYINSSQDDRVGIIIFSEKIYTLLPLTTDLELVKKVVSEIKVGPLGSGTKYWRCARSCSC